MKKQVLIGIFCCLLGISVCGCATLTGWYEDISELFEGEEEEEEPTTTVLPAQDGPEGFLWKPESESTGELIVIFPNPPYRRDIDNVGIHTSPDLDPASLIEAGEFFTDTHNGNRAHYKFNHGGAHYGNNIFVVVRVMSTGNIVAWTIPNGAERWD